jgi:hypothetical protein
MKIRFIIFYSIAIGSSIVSCNNLDNASPSDRNTFTYFYGGAGNFEAKGVEISDDGFLVVGDSLGTAGFGILIIS